MDSTRVGMRTPGLPGASTHAKVHAVTKRYYWFGEPALDGPGSDHVR